MEGICHERKGERGSGSEKIGSEWRDRTPSVLYEQDDERH